MYKQRAGMGDVKP